MSIDTTIRYAREVYPKQRNQAVIRIGMSHHLIMVLACVHFSFGVLLSCKEFVGQPLTCYQYANIEQACLADFHYYIYKGDSIQRFAFFKITTFIFVVMGKYTTINYYRDCSMNI